jgi:hypothetical protein
MATRGHEQADSTDGMETPGLRKRSRALDEVNIQSNDEEDEDMAHNKETFVLTVAVGILGLAASFLPASLHAATVDEIQAPRGRAEIHKADEIQAPRGRAEIHKADEIQAPRGRAEIHKADEIQAPRGEVQPNADDTQAPSGSSATEAGKGGEARR